MKRSFLVLAVVLAWCFPAHAAIAHDGNVAVAATSGTFSGTATGSFKVLMAIRFGSTTPPTLPAGWTQIVTSNYNASSAASWRIACNISSSAADTGTGTWTNASHLDGISFSGTAGGTTADCNTTGLGCSLGSLNSNTVISYGGCTLTKTDGTSWVMAFCGESTGTSGIAGTAPTGMTNVNKVGTNPSSGVHDTNSGVSSWSTQTVTTATTPWMTWVGEILASTGSKQVPRLMLGGVGD